MSTNYVIDRTSCEDVLTNSFCTLSIGSFRTQQDEPTVWTMLAVEWLLLANRGKLVWKNDDGGLKRIEGQWVQIIMSLIAHHVRTCLLNHFAPYRQESFRTQDEPTVWMLAIEWLLPDRGKATWFYQSTPCREDNCWKVSQVRWSHHW